MPQPRGLGRGLESLIPQGSDNRLVNVNPGLIKPNPHQPRKNFKKEELEDLAQSLKKHGVLQPLIVTPAGEGYELVAGERRLRAAKLADLQSVPVIVRTAAEQQKLEWALIENIQRANLNPIETATAYRNLLDQFNLSMAEVAKAVGKNESTVTNSTRLLGLPEDIQAEVVSGNITEGHARSVLSLKNADEQRKMVALIKQGAWTVRQAEAYARSLNKGASSKKEAIRQTVSSNEYTQKLSLLLSTKVSFQSKSKGGKLVIEYSDEEDLARIINLMS